MHSGLSNEAEAVGIAPRPGRRLLVQRSGGGGSDPSRPESGVARAGGCRSSSHRLGQPTLLRPASAAAVGHRAERHKDRATRRRTAVRADRKLVSAEAAAHHHPAALDRAATKPLHAGGRTRSESGEAAAGKIMSPGGPGRHTKPCKAKKAMRVSRKVRPQRRALVRRPPLTGPTRAVPVAARAPRAAGRPRPATMSRAGRIAAARRRPASRPAGPQPAPRQLAGRRPRSHAASGPGLRARRCSGGLRSPVAGTRCEILRPPLGQLIGRARPVLNRGTASFELPPAAKPYAGVAQGLEDLGGRKGLELALAAILEAGARASQFLPATAGMAH